jgi:hypothetical protein
MVVNGYSQDKNTEKKTIVFIDDFDRNSELEPNYYQYFKKIVEGQLFGDLNYKRLNIDFDISGPKSIRKVDLSFKPDYVVVILGTSATTINSNNSSINISAIDYKNEYIDFIKRITPQGAVLIVVSPPPYPTKSEDEDIKIIENINAVQDVVESSNYSKIYYIKLYKYVLRNYQESAVSPKELSTWLVRLIKDKVKELDNNN